MGRKAIGPKSCGIWQPRYRKESFFVSKIIISLIITIFLVVSPILGQFAYPQTSANTQESLSIENPKTHEENNNESNARIQSDKSKDKEIAVYTKVQETQDAQETEEDKGQPSQQTAKSNDKSVSNSAYIEQPEVSSKPAAEVKSTAKPKASQVPANTASKAGATSTSASTSAHNIKATSTPAPTAMPNQSPTPKPSPTVPVKSESSAAESKESKPANNEKVFDTSKVDSGTLGVRYTNTSGKRVKLMIEKDGSRYTYNLAGDGSLETFPLQSGNGEYTVSIMENTEGNKYRYVLTEKISVNAKNENSPYLGSVQMINWNSNMAAIKKAQQLTSGVSDDETKVKKIYNFVVSNIRYDHDKLDNLPSTYIPNIEKIYSSKSGICYDFASLTAAMLRSVGVPTKLVMGYADGVNGYHAWNEVYVGGKWILIDTSYDSQMRENGASYSMKKNKGSYQAKKVY